VTLGTAVRANSTAPRVVLVTDASFGDDVIERCVLVAGAKLSAGTLCVQVRDRSRLGPSLRMFAGRLRVATRSVGAWLVVNGDARIARDVGADGVHLGRGAGSVRDARSVLRDAWVSVAAHSDEDVWRASDEGADAVLVSPVFATRPPFSGAQAKEARGVGAIRSARALAKATVAVYALGGVTPENARACVEAGADGVAVLRALLASADPARAARAIDDATSRR
jgi:thiamine-phosphate pyrophosphorylase